MLLDRVRCKVLGYPCPTRKDARWFWENDPDVRWLREQKHAAQNATAVVEMNQEWRRKQATGNILGDAYGNRIREEQP